MVLSYCLLFSRHLSLFFFMLTYPFNYWHYFVCLCGRKEEEVASPVLISGKYPSESTVMQHLESFLLPNVLYWVFKSVLKMFLWITHSELWYNKGITVLVLNCFFISYCFEVHSTFPNLQDLEHYLSSWPNSNYCTRQKYPNYTVLVCVNLKPKIGSKKCLWT